MPSTKHDVRYPNEDAGTWDTSDGQVPMPIKAPAKEAAVPLQQFELVSPQFGMQTLVKLPDPPKWIMAFFSNRMKSAPRNIDDETLISWVRSFKDPFRKASTAHRIRKDRVTNAQRFQNALPPLPPRGVAKRLRSEADDPKEYAHQVWVTLLEKIIVSRGHAKDTDEEALDALWELLAHVVSARRRHAR